MAGVAGPMLRRSRSDGTRFLTGLFVGWLTAAIAVGYALDKFGHVLEDAIGVESRLAITVGILLLLGMADTYGRTPHIWRQVPQALIRVLRPGRLGLRWGVDLGLLVTTQKTTSLLWAALIALTLLDPTYAMVILVEVATVSMVAITIRSIRYSVCALPQLGDGERWWFRTMRYASGFSIILCGLVLPVLL